MHFSSDNLGMQSCQLTRPKHRQLQNKIKEAGIPGSWPCTQPVYPDGGEETTAHQVLEAHAIKENTRLFN